MPLTELHGWNTEVANLLPLKGMRLKILELGGTKVSDLSLLKGMRLTKFTCWRTGVTDLSPLKGMPLELLWIDHTQISNLSPLQGMPLTHLSLYSTEVSDLSPLRGMKLIEVWFTPKNITKGLNVFRSMKSLKIIGITWSDHEKWPPTEFWEKYDAGEFSKPSIAAVVHELVEVHLFGASIHLADVGCATLPSFLTQRDRAWVDWADVRFIRLFSRSLFMK